MVRLRHFRSFGRKRKRRNDLRRFSMRHRPKNASLYFGIQTWIDGFDGWLADPAEVAEGHDLRDLGLCVAHLAEPALLPGQSATTEPGAAETILAKLARPLRS